MITCSSLQDKDPLVNVSCCGQIMKRADEKEHEVETCTKRKLQLVTELVLEQKEEIDDMKSSLIPNSVPSNDKQLQVDEIVRLTETRIGNTKPNFIQLSEKRRGRKSKYRVDVKKLIDIICVYGLPPCKVMGSMTTADGYWTRVCRELTGRQNPSYEYIKVVYSYWNKNRKNVKSSVEQILSTSINN